ncbi:hypothetical protein SISNIDRAFT_532880 [Sistotremastrum niveocremeum HHB9708]|uniref:F-box domain-containing protein n=1 Tax=Sistotremastrum niveocremeum HHB9708 TaxID=1314777 RepID=A0A164NTH0_9AGAM|nr:hypothetical protein SISNIDRAFT_532880 [Sistotremastrum niveocremeum HHB9708]
MAASSSMSSVSGDAATQSSFTTSTTTAQSGCFSMLFSELPFEIFEEIIFCYEDDELPIEVAADQRLQKTLLLCQIRRFRQAAHAHHSLWTIIYLHWPDEAVQYYLERFQDARQLGLSIFLNTQVSRLSERVADQARWAQFLRNEMKDIVELEIIMSGGNNPVAQALNDTPAPRLESWTLILDEKAQDNNKIRTPFQQNAPVLRSARIYACRPFDLSSFTSLSQLTLRIGHHNFKRLLELLRGVSSSLETLKLKGVEEWDLQLLPANLPAPVVLSNCTSLSLKNIEAHRACYLLSNIVLPSLSSLHVDEKMVPLEDDSLLFSISSTLPRLNFPAEADDMLLLSLHPHSLLVESVGYWFRSDWKELDYSDRTLLLQTIIDGASAPATTIFAQPTLLIVVNNIIESRTPYTHSLDVTLEDIDVLLRNMLPTYPSVEILGLMGNIAPMVQALRNAGEGFLPNLQTLLHVTDPDTYLDITSQLRPS